MVTAIVLIDVEADQITEAAQRIADLPGVEARSTAAPATSISSRSPTSPTTRRSRIWCPATSPRCRACCGRSPTSRSASYSQPRRRGRLLHRHAGLTRPPSRVRVRRRASRPLSAAQSSSTPRGAARVQRRRRPAAARPAGPPAGRPVSPACAASAARRVEHHRIAHRHRSRPRTRPARRPRCPRPPRRAGPPAGPAAMPRSRGSREIWSDGAAAHLPHRGGRRGGQLVQPVVAAEQQHIGAAVGEDARPSPAPSAGCRSRSPRPRAGPGWSAGRGS